MNVIFMGPPGSGKGTQASGFAAQNGMEQIATGEMLRQAVRRGCELGKRVDAVLKAGELVPDDLMMDLIRERLQNGKGSPESWLMDGFPRTVPQAEGLLALLEELGAELDAVVVLDVPDEVIVQRLSTRLTCASCGAISNQADPQGTDDSAVCSKCGERELLQRADDREETVRSRLATHHAVTAPVADVLGRVAPVRRVNGVGDRAEVAERIRGVLE